MSAHNIRLEVMKAIEDKVEGFIDSYLVPIEKIWQPTDFLPDSQSDNFFNEVEQIREEAKELGYDFWVTLVADTITEEALPTYESWLMDVEGVDQHDGPENGWAKWVRNWTAEENRHGDVLNKYLYLSGRVNMREVEITTQHLIADGFDIGTDRDPYKNFVYTSFQELATNISHKRVGQMAKKKGNTLLGKMCNIIAGDEMRHHLAYREFVKVIMDQDPNGMILAFADMMKRKIVMPAHFLRESGGSIGTAFETFSNCAQRLGVYTAQDYIEILSKLNGYWDIENLRGLNDSAEKARDYLTKLPSRLQRISDRMKIDEDQYHFKWVQANGML
ncbi:MULTISPECIES: acyl-ACP desaturase [Cellulophaga]|uniref:Acyl-(Acyl-carrier-protein) desaturase n=2 Tax=Cellulophaga TaxID=104264 RepID=F0RFL1_CELLC|nr:MULTISPECIES: acyl-ACP desaturase [Cellulophaga]ADY28959.1 Acyl-(acyl-carrier-protein) desaturase [Cellulophaga lytica DSM 7489]AIM60006.1 fatty acid desaturase [Cellulophaga lytica]EWH13335.1 Acyl-ACP desaturase [Cellulophaga geojensis KL-A]MDO6854405.1 acyl-ACP desaturase [Cellulophaga lytica]WQG76866.1 acyl-ACP desaturase [Cellulophaga lytica]